MRATSLLVFFIVFLDLLGVGLIAPMSPYIVGRFASGGTAVALLTVAYSAAQFLATPVLGALSDRYGRRPVLILSLLGSSAGYVLFASAGALWMLYVGRIIDGFTGGNISTAQAAITDITPEKDRVKVYGLIGAAFGLGFVLGPAFGAGLLWAMPENPNGPIWAAAGLSLAASILVMVKLPETHPKSAATKGPLTAAELNPLAVLLRVVSHRGAAVVMAVVFVVGFAHAELRAVFGKLMIDKLGFEEKRAAAVFAAMGIIAVVVQGGLVRRVAGRIGDRATVLMGLPLAVLGYALIPEAWDWGSVIGVMAVAGLGMGLVGPPTNGILSRSVPARMMGSAFGASQSASSLGLVFGPLVAGPAYDYLGRGWPFWSAAGLLLAGFVIVAVCVPRSRAGASVVAEASAH